MRNFEYYCNDFENIENYDKAKADNFKGWHCHHRLETHNSDGERRLVDISHKELKALNMYYHRPANELIFLSDKEHLRLHNKGNQYHKGMHHSEDAKKKMSESLKGKPSGMKGKHLSDVAKEKISEAKKGKPSTFKGKHHSEEAKKKKSELFKGKHWKIVNGKRVWY
jgi:hypothetical protein